MSKTFTFEVSDEIYGVIQQMAAVSGRSAETVALEWLARYMPKPRLLLSSREAAAAWKRLRRHAGAVNSGDARAADNERIDADLAGEFAGTHGDSA